MCIAWSRGCVLSPPFFGPQLPFTQAHGNPGIPHWEAEIKNNTLSSALHPPSIEHVDSNNGGRALRGGSAEMTRRNLRCPRVEGSLEEGREGGLIEFEVGERQLRWKTRDFKVE